MSIQEKTKKKTEPDVFISNTSDNERFLILHNDDIHTFDYVIDSLIDICKHDKHQAEQCAYIVHYKGKCDVKKGTFTILDPLKNRLIDRGLSVTID